MKYFLFFLLLLASFSIANSETDFKPSTGEKIIQEEKINNVMKEWEERYLKILKFSPPPPPWVKFPDYDRYSIGWRMGAGEEYMDYDIAPYFHFASEIEIEQYKNKYPTPKEWEGWYEE